MKYSRFLWLFVVPFVVAGAILTIPRMTRRELFGLIMLPILAVVWTTPWDNYLVATRVWYYNPALVSGILLGYVPLEEYIFFVLQPIFVGLWLLLWHRRVSPPAHGQPNTALRVWTSIVAACVWIASALVFFSGWQPGTYLSIMLFWALPPILLQLLFGADILWHYRRVLVSVILPLGIYLSLADSLAITASTCCGVAFAFIMIIMVIAPLVVEQGRARIETISLIQIKTFLKHGGFDTTSEVSAGVETTGVLLLLCRNQIRAQFHGIA